MVLGPRADVGRAALEDGDVERVDLDLHELLGADAAGAAAATRRRRTRWTGLGLADQPLERPVAALHDARRDAGQRRDRAERAAAARELEGGDVVLDAVVVAGEGRRPEQVDGAVRADQPAAGERRGDRQEEAEDRRREAESGTDRVVSCRIASPSWAGRPMRAGGCGP